jgi:hypothetical protein
MLAGVAVALLPWGLRNYRQFGEFRVTTSHGGYTLLLGNNPDFYRYLREAEWGDVWHSDELAQAWQRRGLLRDAREDLFALSRSRDDSSRTRIDRTEIEDDRLAYDFARRYIREDPRMFLAACCDRVGRLWQLLPRQVLPEESALRRVLRWSVAAWYGVLYLLVLAAARARPRKLFSWPWQWGILLCIAFTAVHTFYWSDMRMRAPLLPFVALVATLGALQLVNRRSCSA